MMQKDTSHSQGFTLIELSIVLVIIGLIVGGVLVGQDLIKTAEVRAQISQIEKFNSAVNTFRGKYGYLPGDMTPSAATQFGFTVGSSCDGSVTHRDGNGLINGFPGQPMDQGTGEVALFWEDISSANLIDGSFPNQGAPYTACVGGASVVLSATTMGEYFPTAKIGRGNFVYVYETGGSNWFGLSALTSIIANGGTFSSATIPVMQAYNMDRKVDDGLPTTGSVQAVYMTNGNTLVPQSTIAGPTDNALTCYNTSGPAYSIGYNNGANPNCALSFRFQ